MKPRRRRPQKFAQVYSYDRFGNRTIDAAQTWGVGSYNKQFTVNTANNRLGVPAGQSGLMSYDNAGNLTTDTYSGGGDRTVDAENRMTKAWENNQWQVYTYNADGQRVRRKVDGVETWQVYGMDGELVAEYAANVSAATPQKEYGYRNGQLLITTGTAPSSGVTEPAVWSNAVGVSPSGNNLTKTATTGWGNAGAASTRALALGDGYVEFTASETNTARMCGLSNGDSNQDWQDIDFGMYPVGDGGLHVYEGGIYRGVIGSYAAGDRLRVAVEGGVVKYRKNGVLLYTSTVAPTYALLVDTAIYSNGGTRNNVVLSGNLTGGEPAVWSNAVGVSPSGNNLTKTATTGWGNAGAASTRALALGDGYVEFTASETNTARMCGLSNGDSNQDWQDIDFGMYPVGDGGLHVYEGGIYRGVIGSYAAGDRLRGSGRRRG